MTTADDVTVRHGDALDVLAGMPDASVDAVVTDPPAGIAFMGKSWDDFKRSREQFVGWLAAVLEECLRVAKPGAHAVVWALPRTSGWTHRAIEDAGWEVRECVTHLFGSGFPKSLDVSKAIDRGNGRKFEDRFALGRHIFERREALGYTRAEVNEWLGAATKCEHYESNSPGFARVPTLADFTILRDRLGLSDEHLPLVERVEAEREVIGTGASGAASVAYARATAAEYDLTAPATPDAEKWQGWGTALKPGSEHWWMARKPLAGTVAANVLTHGTGALNIDGCRLEAGQDYRDKCASVVGLSSNRNGDAYGEWTGTREDSASPAGRWPANVVLDEDAAVELDRQSGTSTSTERVGPPGGSTFGGGEMRAEVGRWFGDTGGASRFYYTAKARPDERPRVGGVAHPTVKPLELMRWLVRLVTPPGGLVLDPFAGSGTTGEACLIEGFRCVLIENYEDYLPLIEARLSKPLQPVLGEELSA